MNKLSKILYLCGFAIGAVVLFIGIFAAASRYLSTHKTATQTGQYECATPGVAHETIIAHSTFTPSLIEARACDTLTIVNNDNKLRRIAFGKHNHHQAYNGVLERSLSKGEKVTVTLVQEGDFIVHDHLQEEVGARFRVTK